MGAAEMRGRPRRGPQKPQWAPLVGALVGAFPAGSGHTFSSGLSLRTFPPPFPQGQAAAFPPSRGGRAGRALQARAPQGQMKGPIVKQASREDQDTSGQSPPGPDEGADSEAGQREEEEEEDEEGPKEAPRGSQQAPKSALGGLLGASWDVARPCHIRRGSQEAPKRAPRRPQEVPRELQGGPKRLPGGPEERTWGPPGMWHGRATSQEASRRPPRGPHGRPHEVPRGPEGGPKRLPAGPQTLKLSILIVVVAVIAPSSLSVFPAAPGSHNDVCMG